MQTMVKFTLLAVLCATLVGVTAPTPAPAQGKDKEKGLVFEIYKDKGEMFRYRIKEGETLLGGSSKGYKAKADVDKIVDTIMKGASKAKIVDDTKK
jgi:uncharacterized protein YegP (UPF0339 family)